MAMAADGGASGGQRRIVLITGASRGIGAQTARVLAYRGDHVVINYREKRKRAETLAAEITAAGGSASVAGADIADPVGARGLVESVVAEFGRLDVLVLNASGGLERDAVPGYAMLLNRDAQRRLTELALPTCPWAADWCSSPATRPTSPPPARCRRGTNRSPPASAPVRTRCAP